MTTPSDPAKKRNTSMTIAKSAGDGTITITGKGLSWLIVLLLGGTGGATLLGNLGLASTGDVERVAKAQSAHVMVDDARDERQTAEIAAHNERLEGITVKIGSFQKVQHWQAGEQAAARLCLKVPKGERDGCKKRILRWSIDKLEKGGDRPCTNLDCD